MREIGYGIIIAFSTGLLSVVQGVVNAGIGKSQGQYVMIIGVSFFQIAFAIALLRLSGPHPAANGWFSPWMLLAGLLGVAMMYGVSKATGTVGALPVFTAALFGQIVASAIADHWGLTGLPRSPMTLQKLGSIATIGVGVYWLLKSQSH